MKNPAKIFNDVCLCASAIMLIGTAFGLYLITFYGGLILDAEGIILLWAELAFMSMNARFVLKMLLIEKAKTKSPPLQKLSRFADLFGLPTRKAIKEMAGDYEVEIRRLRRERRPMMARWNVCLAWGYALWYGLRSPVDALLKYTIKAFKGS